MNAPPDPPTVEANPAPSVREERLWALAGHLSALAGIFFPVLGNLAGPLIVWQVKKDTMPFAAAEAKEAFQFNLTWMLALIVLCAVTIPLLFVFVGILLIPVIALIPVAGWVFSVIAALRAADGLPYRYPLTVRFAL